MSEQKELIDLIANCKGRIYLMGNGGSAANAEHFASDLTRAGYPAFSLVSNVPLITAIGNDDGFEFIFSRQLRAVLQASDLVIGLSCSGNSQNIVVAFQYVKSVGAKSVLLTGHPGGRLQALSDLTIFTPDFVSVSEAENIHLNWIHTICGILTK